jgi:DnaJ-like protein
MGRRPQDHYSVLGVNADAPDEVIRAAYRALAAKYHPDRNPGDSAAELQLKRLNAAFRVVGDPERRKQYDELTQSPEASEPPHQATPNEPPACKAPGESVPGHEARSNKPPLTAPGKDDRAQTPSARAKNGNLVAVVVAGALIAVGAIATAAGLLQSGASTEPHPETTAAQSSEPRRDVAPARPDETALDVPPLLPDEWAPTEVPNYFEQREISSGGIVAAFDACKRATLKNPPTPGQLPEWYCTCTVDSWRKNFRSTADLSKIGASWDQIQRCGAYAIPTFQQLTSGIPPPSPFATPFPRDTASVMNLWNACVRERTGGTRVLFCDCYVDAQLKGKGPSVSPADERKCEILARYSARIGLNLTARQFNALKVPN